MATAGDQINRALRLLGVLAEGETPSAATSQDGLTALNQMLDSWSTERLSVFATVDLTTTWPANQRTRMIGPTGSLGFVGARPIRIEDSTYFVVDGTSYPITLINQEQYNAISDKNETGEYPRFLFVNYTSPDATLYLYPVPNQSIEMHFITVEALTQPATLATELVLPPGYLRAFAYNLACEIAPEFGIEPSPQVQRIAAASKRNLTRINNPLDLMSMPLSLAAGGGYDIYLDS